VGGRSVQGILIPLVVVAFELEAEAEFVAAKVLVLVLAVDAGEALVEGVPVTGESEEEGVLLDGEPGCSSAAPPIAGVVDELAEGDVGADFRSFHFKFDPHMLRSIGAEDVMGHFLGREFFLEAVGQTVEDPGVEFLTDEGG
jgi:hypothetical protein